MSKLFEVVANYDRQTGEDNPGAVRETYLVEAETPSEAEQHVLENIKAFVFGSCEIPSIKKRNFFDIVHNDTGENFYEAKVELITIEGDRESRKTVAVLVQANTLLDAARDLKDFMKSNDCEIVLVKKSAILDVLRYEQNV